MRKFILYKLNETQVNLFLEAFHNKTINNNTNLKRNINLISIDCTENDEKNNNYNQMIKKENDITMIQEEIIMEVDEEGVEEKEDNHEDTMNIIESLGHVPVSNNIIEDSFNYEYDIAPNRLPISSLKSNRSDTLRVLVERIDLNKYKQIDQFSYLINDDQTRLEENDDTSFRSRELSPPKYQLDAFKYKEIRARRPSPNRNNISKLNLFRNVFDDHDTKSLNKEASLDSQSSYSHSNLSQTSHNSSLCDSGFYSTPTKYYRLNDLVSVMINEDYLDKISNRQEKNENHVYVESDDDGFDENELIISTPNSKLASTFL